MPLEDSFYNAVATAVAQGTLTLPTLPDVAMKVDRMCREEDVSAAALATEIGKDPAIAVRLLRIANSAAFGNGARIDSLFQAIVRIGFSITRRLVSGLAMEQMFNSSQPWLRALLKDSWTRSVEVAAHSQLLAAHCTELNPAVAMLGGLVHDVGVLPLIRLAETQPQLQREHVVPVLRNAGPRTGWLVLRAWEFPPELVDVPAYCYDFERDHDGGPDYTDVVSAAIVQQSCASGGEFRSQSRWNIPAFRKLGLDNPKALEEIEQKQAELAQARQVFA
ncbi:MAG TPA: HDOD domain-containing protein [Nevskiaceae bacterium]|nr:HDOD domain-containing protein [Nevskiaceae bacterium]